jgi:hypothetical protein
METAYSKSFPSEDASELALVGEGVENCVLKNLFSEIFLPAEKSLEMNQNRLIATKISNYRNVLQPTHLELKQTRISTERL